MSVAAVHPPRHRLRTGAKTTALGAGVLSAALAIMPVGYALYALLLLDVALPGRRAETVIGLVVMAVTLTIAHALLVGLRQRLLTSFAMLCEDVAGQSGAARTGAMQDALAHGAVAAVLDVAALPASLITLAILAGMVALWPVAALALAIALLTTASGMRRSDATSAGAAWHEPLAGDGACDALDLLNMRIRAEAAGARWRRLAARNRTGIAYGAERRRLGIGLVSGMTLVIVLGTMVARVAADAASVGALAAAVLLTAFILRPATVLVANIDRLRLAWRELQILRAAIVSVPAVRPRLSFPSPSRDLVVEDVALPLPGTRRLLLHDIGFRAAAGDIVALVGPAATGKSALLHLLSGGVPLAAGTIRLDGVTLDQWGEEARARHIGVMPQAPMLLPGSIADNIARFDPAVVGVAVTGAARAAGVHEVILRLPAGYDTIVGPSSPLAMSIQQRIAFARALCGDPFLLLLDHPGSFQDHAGLGALHRALLAARQRGAVTIVSGDSAVAIEAANLVLMLQPDGTHDFGPKDDVRARIAERRQREAARFAAGVEPTPVAAPAG